MKKIVLIILIFSGTNIFAQNTMTPKLLWKLGRVSALGISTDKQFVLYDVGTPDISDNKINHQTYKISINGGDTIAITKADSLRSLANTKISPDGKYLISTDKVKVMNVFGADFYPELKKTTTHIYTSLSYRFWDTYADGKFEHIFLSDNDSAHSNKIDLMQNEPYDCPQKRFGGAEDYIWNPDSKHVLYVSEKKSGTAYALSTNTDLYEYDIANGTTKNLTENNKGADVKPEYNDKGELAWITQKRDGAISDKQDIVVWNGVTRMNLTARNDIIDVESFKWSNDGKKIFFIAPINGTFQLFEVNYPGNTKAATVIKQITRGDFDITKIVGQVGNTLIVAKEDINHASELYSMNINDGSSLTQLTHVNDATYATLGMCKSERRWVTTTDHKKMLVWVVFPPNFDANKKYPTLLYCQGVHMVHLPSFILSAGIFN